MLQIGRRRLILGAAAALLLPKPAIIRTPGLLMGVHQAPGEFEQLNALARLDGLSGLSAYGDLGPSSWMLDQGRRLQEAGWTTWTGHDGATWASKAGFTRRYGGRLVKPNRTMVTSYALESGLVKPAQDGDISDMPPAYIAKGDDFWGVDWDAIQGAVDDLKDVA